MKNPNLPLSDVSSFGRLRYNDTESRHYGEQTHLGFTVDVTLRASVIVGVTVSDRYDKLFERIALNCLSGSIFRIKYVVILVHENNGQRR